MTRGLRSKFGVAVVCASFTAGGMSGQSAPDPRGDVKGGRVDVGEGASLVYDSAGKGRTVVLIHGGLLDRKMWDAQFAGLARYFRVVRYDTRWHGESGGSGGRWSDHEDLRLLLDHLGAKRAAIVGLSMGGLIAIDFALAHPERASAVVAVSPGLSGFEFPDTSASPHTARMRAAWEQGDVEGVAEAFQRMWTDGPRREPGQVDAAVRTSVRAMLCRGVARALKRPQAQELQPPAIGRLREFRAPMLVLVGELDMPDIHTIAGRLMAEVPGARRVVIPGVAHMINMEKPADFERTVVEFLSALPQNDALGPARGGRVDPIAEVLFSDAPAPDEDGKEEHGPETLSGPTSFE
jgi:pimeloyl-ACP methyl ester carboxylesterase